MSQYPIFCAIFLTVLTSRMVVFGKLTIENHGVYQISGHDGVLTASGNSSEFKIYLQNLNGTSDQKWKFFQPFVYDTFLIHPMSNEERFLAVDVTAQNIIARSFDAGTGRFWTVREVAKDGVVLIMNYKFRQCLRSKGLNQPVDIGSCRTTPREKIRWVLKKV